MISSYARSSIQTQSFIALDFETTGKYPIASEICEVALIRFQGQKITDRYQSFIKPFKGMTEKSEDLHGLSLESLEHASNLEKVLPEMIDFIGQDPLVGHNISFDLGFLVYELEKLRSKEGFKGFKGFKELKSSHFCTSYLSLKLWPKLTSHRLIHLATHIGLDLKPNHRAMQDAEVCMRVFCELIKPFNFLDEIFKAQEIRLHFDDYSVRKLVEEKAFISSLVEACEQNIDLELKYSKGSKRNQWRHLVPKGLVLKEEGLGFLVARDPGDTQTKRFMISKIKDSRLKAKAQKT